MLMIDKLLLFYFNKFSIQMCPFNFLSLRKEKMEKIGGFVNVDIQIWDGEYKVLFSEKK